MENLFQEIDYILNFDCPEDVLVERLLDRGKTSGRADDNPESIRNRIKVFNSSTRPALDFYTRFGKVHTVSSTGTIEEVYSQVLKELQKNLIFLYGPPGIDKSNLAQGLSGVAGYRHLELKQLWRKGKGKLGEEEKVNMKMMTTKRKAERRSSSTTCTSASAAAAETTSPPPLLASSPTSPPRASASSPPPGVAAAQATPPFRGPSSPRRGRSLRPPGRLLASRAKSLS